MRYIQKILKVKNVLLILSVVLFWGCATSYKPINPLHNLNTTMEDENVIFKYSYNVLRNAGNERYSKKEANNYIKIVAVSIKNKSEKVIVVSENVNFYTGDKKVRLLSPEEYSHSLKQSTAGYFFYLLLSPLKLFIANGNNDSDPDIIPIGYILGPGITLLNVISASSANKKFDNELIENNIIDKTIEPGEILNGLIAIRDIGYEPLSIKIIKEWLSSLELIHNIKSQKNLL